MGSSRDSGKAGVIMLAFDVAKSTLFQQVSDLAMLAAAVLEHQPSTRVQMRGRARHDGLERVEPPRSGEQREPGLGAERRQAPHRPPQRKAGWRRSCRIADPGLRRTRSPIERSTLAKASARALSRATPNAPGEMSTAITCTRGRSQAMASATAPLPVPRSRTERSSSFGKCPSAISTRISVSWRGTSTAGVTLSGSDQNSRWPVRYATGTPLLRRSISCR